MREHERSDSLGPTRIDYLIIAGATDAASSAGWEVGRSIEPTRTLEWQIAADYFRPQLQYRTGSIMNDFGNDFGNVSRTRRLSVNDLEVHHHHLFRNDSSAHYSQPSSLTRDSLAAACRCSDHRCSATSSIGVARPYEKFTAPPKATTCLRLRHALPLACAGRHCPQMQLQLRPRDRQRRRQTLTLLLHQLQHLPLPW